MNPGDITSATAARAVAGLRSPSSVDPADAYARAVWSAITEPGDSVAGILIARAEPVEALAVASAVADDEWADARKRWLPRIRPGVVRPALDAARRAGVRLVVPGDAEWPRRFDDLGPHAPHALWVRGRSAGDPPQAAAVVGARAATAYGEGVAADLAADLASDGVCIVSGAAYGIDGSAHRAALSSGGTTVAFLAGGVDRAYPRGHEALLTRIVETGGVWSEVPCGAAPTKWRFLARNRLIAALSDAVIVVEAGWRSGSLNTAAHAATLGRALGAVPGPVTSAASAGCHRILREFDGVCVTSAADVREMLGGTAAIIAPPADRTDDSTRVLDALAGRGSRTVDEIARRSGLDPERTRALLGWAELEGRAVRDDDGAWRPASTR